jgi:two-component system, chemotaxis family, chemotaxis protein CheY
MNIGLLEDDAAIQEMLRLVLQDEGHTVTVYSNADECLQALLGSPQEPISPPIGLLIVDWRLSGSISGIAVIRQLRDVPAYSTLPIILTTAAAFHNTEELSFLHVTLLEKPFAIDDVVNLINQLAPTDSTSHC